MFLSILIEAYGVGSGHELWVLLSWCNVT